MTAAATYRAPVEGADTVTIGDYPVGLPVYFGYVDGNYQDYWALRDRYPTVPPLVFGITTGVAAASVMDCEKGNAPLSGIPTYMAASKRAGHSRPCVYHSLDDAGDGWGGIHDVLSLLLSSYRRDEFLLWVAHWTGVRHVCTVASCGVDADMTQWVDHGTWDETEILPEALNLTVPPITKPVPPNHDNTKEDSMASVLVNAVAPDGHPDAQPGDVFNGCSVGSWHIIDLADGTRTDIGAGVPLAEGEAQLAGIHRLYTTLGLPIETLGADQVGAIPVKVTGK